MIINKRVVKIFTFFILNKKVRNLIKFLFVNLDTNKTFEFYKKLQNNQNQQNKILVIEPNNTHGEVVVGIVKYLIDLGFEVDVLLEEAIIKENPFARFKHRNINIFEINSFLLYFMTKKLITKYKKTIITSSALYDLAIGKQYLSFLQNFVKIKNTKNILLVEHDLNDIERFNEKEIDIITLADLPNNIMINPHYFGNIAILPKNKITNFIVVGGIEIARKNHQLLINAIKKLILQNITNFKITIIGNGKLDSLPLDIQPFIDIKGRLDFAKMYDELDVADFFLPLLDSENTEHNRYITTSTSGSFQLIYGFLKPAIIDKKFVKIHKFDNSNSIIYDGDNLSNAMIEAINLPSWEYHIMQNSLRDTAKDIYQKSLNNLEKAINL